MRFASLIIGLTVFLSCCVGCAPTARGPSRPALVSHSVYIKLKNPADAAEIIADGDRDLRTIPGIKSYYGGTRLEPARLGADDSYDVGFFMAFGSREDYQRYLEHPKHVAAVEKWRPRWESIRIFDVIDPTP